MTNLRLSEHFTLAEVERSATATANGIDNTCPSQYIPALEQLCKTILEPLREYAGQPIIISSGYRCNQLNVKVGGVYASQGLSDCAVRHRGGDQSAQQGSQHTLGEAADIFIPKTPYTDWDDNHAHTDMDIAHKWFDFLEHHTDFDQLILETSNGRDYWIHVSCRKNKKANRHQIYRNMRK